MARISLSEGLQLASVLRETRTELVRGRLVLGHRTALVVQELRDPHGGPPTRRENHGLNGMMHPQRALDQRNLVPMPPMC